MKGHKVEVIEIKRKFLFKAGYNFLSVPYPCVEAEKVPGKLCRVEGQYGDFCRPPRQSRRRIAAFVAVALQWTGGPGGRRNPVVPHKALYRLSLKGRKFGVSAVGG